MTIELTESELTTLLKWANLAEHYSRQYWSWQDNLLRERLRKQPIKEGR